MRKVLLVTIAIALVNLTLLASESVARGKTFATNISSGPVAASCVRGGEAAGRVRLDVQVAYSDVRRGLERRLAGKRHRGSLKLTVLTHGGRVLARGRDRDRVGLGHAEDQVHNAHKLLLGEQASRRVLRYAHGKPGCHAVPDRDRRLKVVIEAQQVLTHTPARGEVKARTSSRAARFGASTRLTSMADEQGTVCPPYSCFETGSDLLSWKQTDVRPFDVASVPLAQRVPVPGPKMLAGLDNGAWAYWSDFDLNAQGSARTGNVYNFSHWQYVDTLYYYAHRLVSVPPTVWVNAGHRNGVSVLATVTADCDGCDAQMNELFEKSGPEAVDRLYTMAATYGFDGWMIDVERDATFTPGLIKAMRELKSRVLPSGRPVQVVTYEAQKRSLNDHLFGPFQAAGEWQADYYHGGATSEPRKTFEYLDKKVPPLSDQRYATYWATDVYRPYEKPATACNRQSSSDFIWNGAKCSDVKSLFANLGSARAPSTPPGFYQSLSLYAPGWTMFAGREKTTEPPAPRSVFQAADELLWSGRGDYRLAGGTCTLAAPGQNSVSALLAPRSTLARVPFSTRFNTGEGDLFAVQGSLAAKAWNLLAAQDAVPSGFCSEDGNVRAAIDYDDSFDGGSSLLISGTASPAGRRIYLYEAAAQLPARPLFVLRYRAEGESVRPNVVVWIDGRGPIDLEPAVREVGRWSYSEAVLPAGVTPGTLTRIGIGFGTLSPARVNVRLGEMAVVDSASYQPPAQIVPDAGPAQLTWADPAPTATQFYNVWAVAPGASCANFVGRALLPRYDLVKPLFAIPPGSRFLIQPVSTSGLAAPLSTPPCPA